jgi:hypothetical protein
MLTLLSCSCLDLVFYVMGSAEENELLLMAALSCLFQAVDTILRKNLGMQTIYRRTVMGFGGYEWAWTKKLYKGTKLVFNRVYTL